ncbi:MAG: hypothetical protein EA402_02185 [Planctomycetota bacterium]|nr:MAG: hypothetical protein EA402_02185 [Planctomycetota bacterium]
MATVGRGAPFSSSISINHQHHPGPGAMAFRIYTIPIGDDGRAAEDLNAFLRRVRVLSVQKALLPDGSAWTFCIDYADQDAGVRHAAQRERPGKVDYREVLSSEDFAVYARLRAQRKATAEAQGVPVYALLSNEQLAAIARTRPQSLADLRAIDGIGEAKATSYGAGILACVNAVDEVP